MGQQQEVPAEEQAAGQQEEASSDEEVSPAGQRWGRRRLRLTDKEARQALLNYFIFSDPEGGGGGGARDNKDREGRDRGAYDDNDGEISYSTVVGRSTNARRWL